MKKFITLILLIYIAALNLSAKEKTLSFNNKKTKKHENILQRHHRFEVFQFCIWYKFPDYCWDSTVTGVKAGFPLSAGIGSVKGLEIGFIGAATEHINGLQLALGYCDASDVYGLQLSFVNISADSEDGWQIGMVNSADDAEVQLGLVNYANQGSCQFGLINIIKNGTFPFTLLFNYADTAPPDKWKHRK